MHMLSNPVYRSWFLLRVVYAVVPIVIGLDKLFTWWLVDWSQYASPLIMALMPLNLMHFIMLTAVIEIAAGVVVWLWPKFGGYLVAAWLLLVIINLASMNMFYDIIARDAVIAVGALVLAWLSGAKERFVS